MKKLIIAVFFIIFLKASISAQVAINTTNTPAHASAMLDVSSINKGLLVPRLFLTGASDITTVTSPATSLLIYNYASAGSEENAVTPGYYYWKSPRWIRLSTAPEVAANTWSVIGNANTSEYDAFIGTTDNKPLKFRVNNIAAGGLDPVTGNVLLGLKSMSTYAEGHSNIAIGASALYWNGIGSNLVAIGDSALYSSGMITSPNIHPVGNVAIGSKTLYSNISGYHNTALGYLALYNNDDGYRNTASGAYAMQYNISGNSNTATGYYSLSANNGGDANTAMGTNALSFNTSGNENAAFGTGSLNSNIGGSLNTATGTNALLTNKFGNYNSAVGYRASQFSTGNWNTATGCYALLNTNTGQANVAVGFQAMQYNTTGDNNTAVGTNAGPVSGSGIFSNSTAIGQSAVYTASNQVRVGSTAVTAIGGYANFLNISDIRFKKNVQPETHGLDFILKLEPIVYNMDVHKLNRFIYGDVAADTLFKGTLQKAITDKETILYSGFSAQQVEAAASAIGYNFSGVQKPQNARDHYALAYSEFVVPLVKAVQEQQKMIEDQQIFIRKLEQRLTILEKK